MPKRQHISVYSCWLSPLWCQIQISHHLLWAKKQGVGVYRPNKLCVQFLSFCQFLWVDSTAWSGILLTKGHSISVTNVQKCILIYRGKHKSNDVRMSKNLVVWSASLASVDIYQLEVFLHQQTFQTNSGVLQILALCLKTQSPKHLGTAQYPHSL